MPREEGTATMLVGCPRPALAAAVSLMENERCGQRHDASMCDWFGSGLGHGRKTLWVPIIHPCCSGSMPVLVESAAEPVPSADTQLRDPLRIGNRIG